MAAVNTKYFPVLDGWRGLSILFVLVAHLLPLGPKNWKLNDTVAPMGMALFFILSGFLITNFLIHKSNVADFMLRRLVRILPLAWLYMLIVLTLFNMPHSIWREHFLFYANWPPMGLTKVTSHLWSLCVEMQFYFGVAILFLFFRQKGLLFLVIACIGFTLFRVFNHVHLAINTYYRIDEILAGCILALIYNKQLNIRITQFIKAQNFFLIFLLFMLSCHPASGAINYFRPYLAALLIGCTLFNDGSRITGMLSAHRWLAYLASISYALYVIHPALMHTWLGSGEGVEKYAKRPLLFLALFLLAHLSTFYYEKKWIALSKRISARWL